MHEHRRASGRGQAPVLSQLYALLGVLIFITIGGEGWMLQGLGRTYDLVPMDEFPALGVLTAGTQQAFAGIFLSAVEAGDWRAPHP